MADGTLHLEWNRSGRVNGLLRATIARVPGMLAESEIDLLVDGVAHRVSGRVEDPGAPTFPVTVHTHALANGPHSLAIAVRTDEGRFASAQTRVEIANPGPLADKVRASMRDFGTPLAFAGPCDSSYYDYSDDSLRPWFDRPDAEQHIVALLQSGRIVESEAEMLRTFVRDGYLVIKGAVPDDLVDRALTDIDRAVAEGYQGYRFGDSTRLEHMHGKFAAIRELWLLPRVHEVVGLLFDEISEPCQSLVYVFGSQQDAHQDTVHLTPFPAGYMCGIWVALEDVRPESGELVVYPGSHRVGPLYMKGSNCAKVKGDWTQFGQTVVRQWDGLLQDGGFTQMPYMASRGDVLIWHSDLMHAGTVRKDKSLSRRSMVTHSFARGSLVYYDSTGEAGSSFARPEEAAVSNS
jgi:hypothetical protein